MRLRILSVFGVAVLLASSLIIASSCEEDRGGAADPDFDDDTDTGSDSDADGDADTDVDGDGDSDGDDDDDDDDNNDDDDDTDTEDEILEMDCSNCPAVGGTLDQMVCAIDLCDPGVVLENNYATLTPMVQTDTVGCVLEDTYEAVNRFGSSGNDLAPKVNQSYAMMGTGPVLDEPNHGIACSEETAGPDPFAPDETGDEGVPVTRWDVVDWKLKIQAPEKAKSFQFKYVFFSTEFDDMVSSHFNDKFYVVLEAQSTANGAPTVINFALCRDPDVYYDFVCTEEMAEDQSCEPGEKYCYIAINSAFSDCCWYPNGSEWAPNPVDFPCAYDPNPETNTDISGTGFECAKNDEDDLASHGGSSSGWLQTRWHIEGGEIFTITFHLHDAGIVEQGPQYLDSQVIVDGFQFTTNDDEDDDTIIIE